MFGAGFNLLTADRLWAEAAGSVAATLAIALRAVRMGVDVDVADGVSFTSRLGIGHDGATLVRPDGVIAWRSPGMVNDPAACLAAVLAQVAALRTDE